MSKERLLKSIENLEKKREAYAKRIAGCGGSVAAPHEGHAAAKALVAEEIKGFDVSEDVIQALFLGAMLDEELIKHCGTSSTSGGEYDANFNRDYIFMNVFAIPDERISDYEYAMVYARQNVRKALEAYKNGDPSVADKYAANLMEYYNTAGGNLTIGDNAAGSITQSLLKIIGNVKDTEIFSKHPLTEKAQFRFGEKMKAVELFDKSESLFKDIVNDLPEAGSDKRKEMVLDILTGYVVSKLAGSYASDEIKTPLGEEIEKYAVIADHPEEKLDDFLNEVIKDRDVVKVSNQEYWDLNYRIVNKNITGEYGDKKITYQGWALSDPQKANKYLDKVRNIIKESETYQKAVEEKDLDKVCHLLDNVKTDYFSLKTNDGPFDATMIKLDEQDQATQQELDNRYDARLEDYTKRVVSEAKKAIEKCYEVDSLKIKKGDIEAEIAEGIGLKTKTLGKIYNSKGQRITDVYEMFFKPGDYYLAKENEPGFIKITGTEKEKGVVSFESKDVAVIPKTGKYVMEYADVFKRNYESAKKGFVESDDESLLDTYKQTDAYLKLLEAVEFPEIEEYAKALEAVKNLNELVKAQYVKDDAGNYRDISAEGFDNLKKAYTKSIEALNKYSDKAGYDVCAKNLAEMLKKDAALVEKLPLTAGAESLAMAVFNSMTDAETKQKNTFENRKIDLPESRSYGVVIDERLDKLFDCFCYDQGFYKKYPDGVLMQKGNDFYNAEGKVFSNVDRGNIAREHGESFKEYVRSNMIPYDELFADFTPEMAREKLGKAYVEPSPEELKSKLNNAKNIYTKANEFSANRMLELRLAEENAGTGIKREFFGFMKLDGSEESRQYNNELLKLAGSKNKADVKKAYEMIIKDIMSIPFENYDYLDGNLLDEKFEEVQEFAIKGVELQSVFAGALDNGVDLLSPEYDEFRNKAQSMMSVASIIKSMTSLKMDKASIYCDINKLVNKSFDDLTDIKIDTAIDYPSISSLVTDATFIQNEAGLSNKSIIKKLDSGLFSDRVKLIQNNSSKFGEFDPEDEWVLKCRRKLENNVRTTLFIKRKNSSLYKAVMKSIDDYRSASMIDKEKMRANVVKACEKYLENRITENSRYSLIEGIKRNFGGEDFKKATKRHTRQAYQSAARKLVDGYEMSLNRTLKCFPKDTPNYNKIAYSLKCLDGLKNDDAMLNNIVKTGACKKVAENFMEYSNDPEKLIMLSNKAFDDAIKNQADFSVFDIRENAQVLTDNKKNEQVLQ